MDFGTSSIEDDDVRLLLFGTPGQPRFRFMTNILKGDVDIVAFVIDAEAKGTHAPAGVVPCQLNEPDSGRTVIVEILVSLLSHIETSQVRHERRTPELT